MNKKEVKKVINDYNSLIEQTLEEDFHWEQKEIDSFWNKMKIKAMLISFLLKKNE